MERILTLIILSLLWCNVGFAAEREPGTDKKCLYVFERENIFERKFLPKVNKDKGIFVTYVGCNKYYDDWSWEYSFDSNIDAAHNNAYYRCKTNEIPKYNLTGCHLFSIDDVIVWGKDAAFVAKIEKEAKAKLITKIAKKQSKNAEELNKNCTRKGTLEFNKTVKQRIKKNFVTVMYFGCKSYSTWGWGEATNKDLDRAHVIAKKNCLKEASKRKIETCHLFSINDKIVYGKDAKFTAKVEKDAKQAILAKVEKETEQVYIGEFVYKYLFVNRDVFQRHDPSTLKKLTFKKKRNVRTTEPVGRKTSKKESLRWIAKNFKGYSYIAEYEDDIKIEIFIETTKELKKMGKETEMNVAEKKAKYFANIFGQMPHFIKTVNRKIYVHRYKPENYKLPAGWAPWKNKISTKEFHVFERGGAQCSGYFNNADDDFCYDDIARLMLHELAHVVKGYTKIITPSKWTKAKNTDKKYCSEYAMYNDDEDFAESLVCWIALRYKSHRLQQGYAKRAKNFIENRLKFFDELNLNVHPLK